MGPAASSFSASSWPAVSITGGDNGYSGSVVFTACIPPTPTATVSLGSSYSRTASVTPSQCPSSSLTSTPSVTPSLSPTQSVTPSRSPSPTGSAAGCSTLPLTGPFSLQNGVAYCAPPTGCLATFSLQGAAGGNQITALGGGGWSFTATVFVNPTPPFLFAGFGSGGVGSAVTGGSAGGGSLAALYTGTAAGSPSLVLAIAGGGGGAANAAAGGGSAGPPGGSAAAGTGVYPGGGATQTGPGAYTAVAQAYAGITLGTAGVGYTGGRGCSNTGNTQSLGGSTPGFGSGGLGFANYIASIYSGGGGARGILAARGGPAAPYLIKGGAGGAAALLPPPLPPSQRALSPP